MRLRLDGILAVASATLLACAGCGGDSGESPVSSRSGASSSSLSSSSAPRQHGDAELFNGVQPWTRDVSGSPLSDRSGAIIRTLGELGGWGNGNSFQIDFSLPIFFADNSTPRVTVRGADDYCFGGPDCDAVPAQLPVPSDANFEGSPDLSCDTSAADCHLLVVQRDERKLYEVYQGNKVGDDIVAMGYFVWDLNKAYPDNLRGEQCTSADAAGFPIAALTPTADEVAAGAINHALRFILPNDRMKKSVYVHPASHAGVRKAITPTRRPTGCGSGCAAISMNPGSTMPSGSSSKHSRPTECCCPMVVRSR